jgi:catechol 2,3-dioxygenase-like lactoylglutathione lyase family enzyme
MIDHIGLRSRDVTALVKFYEAALAPLGWHKLSEYEGGAGFGEKASVLWIGTGNPRSAVHLALAGASRAAVDAFYDAALAAGAKDNGKPGLRPDYHANYYAAFVLDPDGNNLEAVCQQA